MNRYPYMLMEIKATAAETLDSMTSLLSKFPIRAPIPYAASGDGMEILLEDGRRLLDFTSGVTGFAVLGYNHGAVIEAMQDQMARFSHMDFNSWGNRQAEELADLLLSQAPAGLDRVYLAGSSGSEAVEAAMKLSYQTHFDGGNLEKSHFISRAQSYSGATLHAMSVSELPILEFYAPLLPAGRRRIPQHYPGRELRVGESLDDYARRGAKDLEDAILDIGPERVAAFVGETMLGTLPGNVPPAPGYWTYVAEVCSRYQVHLILDEVYCGLGRSGKVHCCSWDQVTPDFLCIGKNLAAGYAPLSAVLLKAETEHIIAAGTGRIAHGHTHQGHALGVAAALAVQEIVHQPEMLSHIERTGERLAETLRAELGTHPFFRGTHGRGLMQSLEYDCPERHEFSLALTREMRESHAILVDARYHRTSFAPAYIIEDAVRDRVLDCYVTEFKKMAAAWKPDRS